MVINPTLDYFTVQKAASEAEKNLTMSRENETVLLYQVRCCF